MNGLAVAKLRGTGPALELGEEHDRRRSCSGAPSAGALFRPAAGGGGAAVRAPGPRERRKRESRADPIGLADWVRGKKAVWVPCKMKIKKKFTKSISNFETICTLTIIF